MHRRTSPASSAVLLAAALALSSCGARSSPVRLTREPPQPTSTSSSTSVVPPTTVAPATAPPTPSSTTVAVRLERRTSDTATEGFEDLVWNTLTDGRGWQRARFRFERRDDAPFTVVLAEGDVVDDLCHPYDVGGRFSCQNGSVVALNADRWRHATPEWTGDLDGYRRMLVNHEIGHLLGQHHPRRQCPTAGEPAPVMAQQSTELGECLPNPWPLDWEIDCALRRLEPLAPGYEPDARPRCGPDGPLP